MPHILIVEDEPKISQLLADYLKQDNHEVSQLYDGEHVTEWVLGNAPDLILLDLMLPVKDGLTICREIRQSSDVPIIMITAKIEEIDRLLGLELGADDYICKPFSPREVVARVKTVLRRIMPANAQEQASSIPVLELDEQRYLAKFHQADIELTAIEFNLLNLLASEPGRVFSRQQLMDNIYQDHRVVSERTVDSHIKKLRKKLCAANADEDVVHSVYSVGYKLVL
ncbi:response regulator [Enterovibrio coralii]|uniref:Two-component system response regulator n=1 Tax=Enterovibrio coralii TaxID=294935 RepID=A0A135I9E1_9GAMM|nr:response regulator [Enterovibrio coralii]KXF82070.1 two-component system response regulator [Enterovibrio coralii]